MPRKHNKKGGAPPVCPKCKKWIDIDGDGSGAGSADRWCKCDDDFNPYNDMPSGPSGDRPSSPPTRQFISRPRPPASGYGGPASGYGRYSPPG